MKSATLSFLLLATGFAVARDSTTQPAATAPSTSPATAPVDPPPATDSVPPPAPQPARRTTPTGLTIVEVGVTENAEAARVGDVVYLHYTGKLEDGTVFDTSLKPRANEKDAHPISFTLGTGAVLKGWDEGVVGMKVGQKRQLLVPAALAYGAKGNPPVVPPNANLVFEVELVGLIRGQ